MLTPRWRSGRARRSSRCRTAAGPAAARPRRPTAPPGSASSLSSAAPRLAGGRQGTAGGWGGGWGSAPVLRDVHGLRQRRQRHAAPARGGSGAQPARHRLLACPLLFFFSFLDTRQAAVGGCFCRGCAEVAVRSGGEALAGLALGANPSWIHCITFASVLYSVLHGDPRTDHLLRACQAGPGSASGPARDAGPEPPRQRPYIHHHSHVRRSAAMFCRSTARERMRNDTVPKLPITPPRAPRWRATAPRPPAAAPAGVRTSPPAPSWARAGTSSP